MSPKVKQLVKACIAVVVVVGLTLAARSSYLQWKAQQAAALAEIADLERAISDSESQKTRLALTADLERARDQVPTLRRLDWGKILIGFLLYLVSLLPGGMVLHEATRTLGYEVSRADSLSAQVVGHLGKYVPGKAMVVVIRAGRLNEQGVPLLAGSIAVFLETLLMMAVGAALAGALIFFLPVPRWIAWVSLAGGIGATLPTLPPVLRRVVGKIGLKRKGSGAASESHDSNQELLSAVSHGWRFFAAAWFWQLIAWALIGASFCCLVFSLPGGTHEHPLAIVYVSAVAAIALAMVVGFASLLPGGAGVRELTLTIVLAPVIGTSRALLAAILARMLFIAVELFAVVLVTRFRRKMNRNPEERNERNLP